MADWTTDAVDTIEKVVGAVRERTVVPARKLSRSVVFGALAGFCLLPVGVLLVIGLFRVIVIAVQGEVWGAWLILGGIFVAAGIVLWAKRSPRSTET